MLSHVWNDCIYLKLFSSAFLHSPTHVSSPTSCILLVSHTVSESIINAYTPLVCINVPTNRLKPAHLPKHLASLPPHPHPQGRLKLQKRSISVLQWVCLFQIIKPLNILFGGSYVNRCILNAHRNKRHQLITAEDKTQQ